MLTWPDSEAKSFPRARGTMIRKKKRREMYGVGATFKTVSVGPRKAQMANKWTIVTVIGRGNTWNICFMSTLLVALIVYQHTQRKTIFTACRRNVSLIFSLYCGIFCPTPPQ